MYIEDLIIRLRIKENNKVAENRTHWNSVVNGENITTDDPIKTEKRKEKYGQQSSSPKKEKIFNYTQFGNSIHIRGFKEGQEKGSRKH